MWLRLFTALSLAGLLATPAAPVDPFAFFRPSVIVSADDRQRLERGEPIAHVLRGADHDVGVLGIVKVNIDGDRLVAWTRRIEDLKKSAYVLQIGRFSSPPRIDDLKTLTLDDDDLIDIRRCRPKSCDLKLTGAEIDHLRQVAADAGAGWKAALQEPFREIVLHRVQGYIADGFAAPDGFDVKAGPLSPGARFSSLLRRSSFLAMQLPQFTEYLDHYPHAPMAGVESFIYWSKERVGGKPMISATQVSIVRNADLSLPDALVVGTGIFATHYLDASLSVTALIRGPSGSPSYLAYMNRSDVDVVRGIFKGMVRWAMERRLRDDSAGILLGLRRRLESGDPESGGRE